MVNTKPKIGISLRIVSAPNYPEKRDAISHDWIYILENLGFTPIFIPNTLKNLDSFLKEFSFDGIILSGGENLGNDKSRDDTEKKLLSYAIDKKIPVLGVCRGMQLINDYFGGTLSVDNSNIHTKQNHLLKIINKKFSMFSSSNIDVNSYHKNLILKNTIGNELKPFAICNEDDTIEGFFHENYPIIGVMWHPERNPDEKNKQLLSNFLMKKNFLDD